MVRQAGQQTRDHTLSVPKYLSNLSCWQNIFHSSSASQTSYTLIMPYMCFKLYCIFIFVFEYLFCWTPLSSSVSPSGDPKSPLVSPQGNVYIQYTIHSLSYILYILWWDLVSPRGNAGNAVWDRCRSRYPPVFVASIVHTGIPLFSQVRKYSWQRCPEDSWQEALLSPAPLIFRGQVRLKHLLSSNTFVLWACLQHLLISTAYVLEAQGKGFDFCVST